MSLLLSIIYHFVLDCGPETAPGHETMATIAVVGALDTKGRELAFLKEQIEQRGHQTRVVDTGVLGEPAFLPS